MPRTWYLTSYHNDLAESLDIESIDPPISPNLVINDALEFTAQAACNTFSGRFVEDTTGEGYILENFQKTTNTCSDPEHIQFEEDYELVLAQSGNLFLDARGTTNGDSYLWADNQIFGFMRFRNTPLLNTVENTFIDFTIYPNPVASELHIVSASETIEQITIYSLQGTKISVFNNKLSIDVSGLANGLYFVEVASEEKIATQKFIKE